MSTVEKIVSGGQTGADQAGLVVGKRFMLKTGGCMPKGFKTEEGPRPDFGPFYGIVEHASDYYQPRTEVNVKTSDGTVRFAADFSSKGEVLTLKCVKKHNKPHFDVDLTDPPPVRDFANWLYQYKIKTLNVAGNKESTFEGTFKKTCEYLTEALFLLGKEVCYPTVKIAKLLGFGENVQAFADGDFVFFRRK